MRTTHSLILASTLLAAGCTDEFTPYNFIEGFRVLAVSSSEPALEPGAVTALDTLVAWGTDTTTVTYSWSWCPFSTGSLGGYQCAITEQEARSLFGAIPPYELGKTSSIAFSNPIDPATGSLITGFCTSNDPMIPEEVKQIGCRGRLPVSFRVEVADDDETIVTVKEVDVLLEPDPDRNTNPTATKLVARRDGVGDPQDLANEMENELIRGQDYEIVVEIEQDESEFFMYTPPDTMVPERRREALTFTWFVNAGETDASRTRYLDGEVSFAEGTKNTWTIPRSVDYAGDTATIVVVIRDGRKGVSWLQRTVRLRG